MGRHRGAMKYVTEQAKELADFVEYLNKSDDVTALYVIEAYRGANLQEIKENGHDKFWFYSSGSNNRLYVNKLLVHLVLQGVFQVCRNTNTGDPVIDFLTAYITINPTHDLINSHFRYDYGDLCIGELYLDGYPHSYPYPVDIRIPRGPAETWISPLRSTSPISSSTSATMTVEQNMGHPKLALIREQCRDALLKSFLKMTVKRRTKLSCIENLPAIKSMSDVLPKTKDELMKIQNVTEANFEEFGKLLLSITKKYRDEADKLIRPPSLSEKDSSVFHVADSDLDMKSGQNSVDAKLKSSCGDGDRTDKVKPPSDSDSSEFDFDSDSEMNSGDAKRKSSCSNGDKADELEPPVPSDSVFDFDNNDSEMKNGHRQNSSDAKRKSSCSDGDKAYKVKPPPDSDSSVFDFDDNDSETKSGRNISDGERKSSCGDGYRANKVTPTSDSDCSAFDFDDSDSEMKSGQNSDDAKRKSSCGDEGDTKRLKYT